MKKIGLCLVALLISAVIGFCQPPTQSEVERVFGFANVELLPGVSNMESLTLNVFTALPFPKALENANGFLTLGFKAEHISGAPSATYVDSINALLYSIFVFTNNDTLWSQPCTLMVNDSIKVGSPAKENWNQMINVGDLQMDIVAAASSHHRGFMPAMAYVIEIWRQDFVVPASKFRIEAGYVSED